MVKLVLTPEQQPLVTNANGLIEFVEASGNSLGFFSRDRELEEGIRLAMERLRSDQPRRTTQEVLDRLKRMEEEGL